MEPVIKKSARRANCRLWLWIKSLCLSACVHICVISLNTLQICTVMGAVLLWSSSGWKHPSRVLHCDSLGSTPSFYYSNYTLTLHCTFLMSGDIKYDLQPGLEQRRTGIPSSISGIFLLGVPLVTTICWGIYCFYKDPNTWPKPEFKNISMCVWQAILFAEAPVARVDEITYFSSPAVMQKAISEISNLWKGFTDDDNWAHRLEKSCAHIPFESRF